ncbi:MAG: universal stress protein [Clostridia bacterium]|nr:universal stress protein [Clostridia bacterium]
MKKILVPYDGSESAKCAAKTAVLLAEKFDSQITFITVVNSKPSSTNLYDLKLQEYMNAYRLITKHEKEVAEGKLKELVKELGCHGVKTETLVVEGIPDEQIIKKAKNGNYDMIVMGRRGLRPVKRLFLGSVSQKVLADSPCSVLLDKGI